VIHVRNDMGMQTSPIASSPVPNSVVTSIPVVVLTHTLPLITEDVLAEPKIEEHFVYVPIGSPTDSLVTSFNSNVDMDVLHMRSFEQEMKDELSVDMNRSKASISSPASLSITTSTLSFTRNTTNNVSPATAISSAHSRSMDAYSIQNESVEANNSDHILIVTVGSPTDSLRELTNGKVMLTTEVQTSPVDVHSVASPSVSHRTYETDSSISVDQTYGYVTLGSPTDSLTRLSTPLPVVTPGVVSVPAPRVPSFADAIMQTSPAPTVIPSPTPTVVSKIPSNVPTAATTTTTTTTTTITSVTENETIISKKTFPSRK